MLFRSDPGGKLLVRNHPNGSKTYYVYGLGLLYEVNQADATKTYHFDQVGSTLLRTNDSGKVIGQAEYSAYGLTTWKQGDMATPFLYNGQAGVQTDPNGLLNMRARYYSPYLMRFLNADPIGFSGGSNWFAYADGNPISMSDPFGLCADRNACTGGTGRGGGSVPFPDLSSITNSILGVTRSVGDENPWIGEAISAVSYNLPLEALGPNPGMFFEGLVVKGAQPANTGVPQVLRNQAAGNAARDAIAASRPGSLIEQNFRVTGGLRRVDVLDDLTGIESKVGRTSLTPAVRQELARDIKIMRSGQLDAVEWHFSPSGTTGLGGPTGPLRAKLDKFGIPIVE